MRIKGVCKFGRFWLKGLLFYALPLHNKLKVFQVLEIYVHISDDSECGHFFHRLENS